MENSSINIAVKEKFLSAYDNYSAPLLRHIYFRVNNPKIAEDLVQETFLKAWQYIVSGEKEVRDFKTFLYRVAANLIIDYYRAKAKFAIPLENVDPKELADDPQIEEQIDEAAKRGMIEQKIFEMKDEYKEILLLRYVDDLKIKEISEITGKTPDNVSVMIHRGLKMLREKINGGYKYVQEF